MNMKQAGFKKLVCGQSKGAIAVALRFLLSVIAVGYGIGVAVRNWMFDKGLRKVWAVTTAGLITSDRAQASVPVISIGNLTVGGTGKTPMVIWLCNLLWAEGINCAILTRGYKSAVGRQSDEPAVLMKNCSGAAVIVNPDRLAGALEAVKRRRSQVLIMDDGFQHRRLHRDIDILAIDSTLPFGYGKLLPAGLLRERTAGLKRAHAVVITRCDLVSEDELAKLTEAVIKINPKLVIARTIHLPVCARTADKDEIPPAKLRGKKVFAFCGIANPDAFFATIGSLGVNLVGLKIYDDHHKYKARDTSVIYRGAVQSGAELILTTEKDYSKIELPADKPTGMVLAYLAVEMQFVAGQGSIMELIERSLEGKIPHKRTV